jgi:hypothetical protein
MDGRECMKALQLWVKINRLRRNELIKQYHMMKSTAPPSGIRVLGVEVVLKISIDEHAAQPYIKSPHHNNTAVLVIRELARFTECRLVFDKVSSVKKLA